MGRSLTGATCLMAAIAGCSPQVTLPPSPQPLPYIAILQPPPPGQTQILLLARIEGRFAIDDDGVRIRAGKALMTPVFYDGTIMDRDADGVFVEDAKTGMHFHNGDHFVGGGGELPSHHIKKMSLAAGSIPQACQGELRTLNPGLERR